MIKNILVVIKLLKKVQAYLSKSTERVAWGVVSAVCVSIILFSFVAVSFSLTISHFHKLHKEAMDRMDTLATKSDLKELICYIKYKTPCFIETQTQYPKNNEIISRK